MTKLRLSGTLAFGTVFAVTVIAYSFFQPFISGAVCEAIPWQASFVFRADSLNEILQSPVCSQLDKALGAGNTLRDLVGSGSWSKLAASSEIAVADIPFRSAGEEKSWAAASWVGWRSPWIRWKLEHSRDKNLELLGKHSVWPIWRYRSPDLARGKSLTIALTDNLIIVCLSEQPTDILLLLDTYDKRVPAAPINRG